MKTIQAHLLSTALLCLVLVTPGRSATPSSISSDSALQRLAEGNKRFVSGNLLHPDWSSHRRAEVATSQHPIAVILACADSRVAPEIVFDQGIGNLFVLRNAGNVLDDHTIGSIEYAIEHLGTPLIVVVGHQRCGAVSAAVKGGELPGHIHSLVDAIAPGIEKSLTQPGDKIDNAVRANANHVAGLLRHTGPIIGEAVQAGKVRVVAARYDLESGAIEILQ